MPQLEWNEGLSVGVEAIDNDHKILLDLINKISFAIEKNEETSVIEEVFGQLEAYVVEHFSREEQLMRDCHYPGLREHIKLHRKLTSKVPELKAKLLAADSREAAEEINLFLFDWLMNHILGDDMLFAQQAYDEGFADLPQQQHRKNTSIRKVTSWLGRTFTLRQRIILTAVIPITSIALLCMTVFWMSFQRFSDIEQLLNVTQITEEVNELSHNLQTERGLSTAVISSNYSQLEYQLKNQRKETDQAYNAFTDTLNQLTPLNVDSVISMQISATQAQLQQLNHQRVQIDQQVSSPQQVLSFYADLVSELFRIPEDSVQLQVDPELAHLLTAYSAVLHMKEASGLQRALGIRAIIKDQFSPEEYEHYASLIGEQRSFLKIFKQFTSEQQRHILLPFFEGDEVLKAFCQVCYNNARKTDIVARLGGEEFAILLPDASLRQAHQLAERVCQATRELKIKLPDIEQTIRVTVSIGIAAWSIEKFNSIDDMLEIADQALYKAKHTGRDKVC